VAAQSAGPDALTLRAEDPIRCWWRTTTSGVRVGEPFKLILTCAILEAVRMRVTVDYARLDAAAVQFPPFDVVDGTRAEDWRLPNSRLFQYEYTLRIVSDQVFGQDVVVPPVPIAYRLETQAGNDATAIQGREQVYLLPAQSMRVLSTVPADASDIRMPPARTFADVAARTARARWLAVAANLSFGIAAVAAVALLVQVVRRRRATSSAERAVLSDAAILKGLGHQLDAIARERELTGWTPDLVGRALAASRVAAASALTQPIGHAGTSQESAGTIPVDARGWRRQARGRVFGTVTPEAMRGRNGGGVEQLQRALEHLTRAHYGRSGILDNTALDETLQNARRVVEEMQSERATWRQKVGSIRQALRRGVR
jgi:hypothetical protein